MMTETKIVLTDAIPLALEMFWDGLVLEETQITHPLVLQLVEMV